MELDIFCWAFCLCNEYENYIFLLLRRYCLFNHSVNSQLAIAELFSLSLSTTRQLLERDSKHVWLFGFFLVEKLIKKASYTN